MDDKGIPIILVSLAILFVPVKAEAEIPTDISKQLELIRSELANQGRRIEALEHTAAAGRRTPGYNVVAPSPPAETDSPSLEKKLTTGKPGTPAQKSYTVRLGDSLSTIAKRHGVTVDSIVEANALASPDKIKIGQRIVIPVAPASTEPPLEKPKESSDPLPPTSAQTHEVQAGETLFGIARTYGVKVETIQAHNGIADPTTVWAGQVLRIPGKTKPAAPEVATTKTTKPAASVQPAKGAKDGKHTIVRGESLTKIAKAHGVSVADLQSANGINNPDQIFIGQTLYIPRAGEVARKVTAQATATKVAAKPNTATTQKKITPKQQTAPRTEDLGVDDFMGYYVVKGDTVESIASIFNTSPSRLRQINDMASGAQFKAGEQILVPAGSVFSS